MQPKIIRFLLYCTLLCLIFDVSKGILYREIITYKEINQRKLVKIEDKTIKTDLDFWLTTNEYATTEQMIDFATWYTTSNIDYTFGKCSINPNHIFEEKKTNCIGYSALLNAVITYLSQQKGIIGQVKSEHKVGKLYCLGINLHQFFTNPAFRDHDYNVIFDKGANKKYVIDPTLSANIGIKDVVEQPQAGEK
jgi:hypothetical protein